eukprot:5868165-Heterocapsa_arctica.AAC.1
MQAANRELNNNKSKVDSQDTILDPMKSNNNKVIGMTKHIQNNIAKQNARKQEEEEGNYRHHQKLKMQQ